MDRIDPEHLREMGRKALRNLLDTQHSYIRELLDDDAALHPGSFDKHARSFEPRCKVYTILGSRQCENSLVLVGHDGQIERLFPGRPDLARS